MRSGWLPDAAFPALFVSAGAMVALAAWLTPPSWLLQWPLVLIWGSCWLSFLLLLWQIWLLRRFRAPRPWTLTLGLVMGCLALFALQIAASRALVVWLTRFQHSLFALELILLTVFGFLPWIKAGRGKLVLGLVGGLLMGFLLNFASFNMHATTELSRMNPLPTLKILGPWANQPAWFLQSLWPGLDPVGR